MTTSDSIGRTRAGTDVWGLADFRLLWWGKAISGLGSQVTMNALPLIAVLSLNGSGTRVGLLQALYMLPFLLLTLPAGIWLERRARRPVMVATDLARAALVLTVPMAAWFDALGWPHLFAVAVLGGALTVVSEIAAVAYLPTLVGARRLSVANSRLHVNLAFSGAVGPGLTGWWTAALGAASLLVLDCVSYLVSAMTLLRIRHREATAAPAARRDPRRELREGLWAVFGNAPIRNAAAYATIYTAGMQFVAIASVIYLISDVRLGAGWYGLTLMLGGLGGVLGTLAAPALVRAHGYGRVMLAGLLTASAPMFLVPASDRPHSAVVLCGIAFFLAGAGSCVTGSAAVTLRHLLTPPALHARMNASYRLLQFAVIPVGAGLAGVLVDAIGARTTLWICPLALLAAAIPLALRPLRTIGSGVGEIPDPAGV